MAFKPITGTFLDGIACDIPSNNWTPDIWRKEFQRYHDEGIDEAYIIRVGWNDSSMFDSKVMHTTLVPEIDMVRLFLDLGAEFGVRIYMGLFDTNNYWRMNDWPTEVAINLDLIDELRARYDGSPAWAGWYMSHEGSMNYHQTRIWKPLCERIRSTGDKRPIMVSPRYAAEKWAPPVLPPAVHAMHMETILQEMEGLIDIYAPMDGHTAFNTLEGYFAATAEVMHKYGARYWSNLETFDRDMPWRFPPIEFAKLKFKLELGQKYVEKFISFELPHFMSPYSMYPSAHTLHDRYLQYLKTKQG